MEIMLFIFVLANALVSNLLVSVTSWHFLWLFLWPLRNPWWQGGSKTRFSCSTNTTPYHWAKEECSLAAEWINKVGLILYLKLGSGVSELGENCFFPPLLEKSFWDCIWFNVFVSVMAKSEIGKKWQINIFKNKIGSGEYILHLFILYLWTTISKQKAIFYWYSPNMSSFKITESLLISDYRREGYYFVVEVFTFLFPVNFLFESWRIFSFGRFFLQVFSVIYDQQNTKMWWKENIRT